MIKHKCEGTISTNGYLVIGCECGWVAKFPRHAYDARRKARALYAAHREGAKNA